MIFKKNESPEKENFFLNSLLTKKVSGAIVVPTTGNGNYSFFQDLVRDGFPRVLVDRKIEGLNIDSLSINNELEGYLATSKLIESGHTEIGIVCGIKALSNTTNRLSA